MDDYAADATGELSKGMQTISLKAFESCGYRPPVYKSTHFFF
jgi:hypothetical protein